MDPRPPLEWHVGSLWTLSYTVCAHAQMMRDTAFDGVDTVFNVGAVVNLWQKTFRPAFSTSLDDCSSVSRLVPRWLNNVCFDLFWESKRV